MVLMTNAVGKQATCDGHATGNVGLTWQGHCAMGGQWLCVIELLTEGTRFAFRVDEKPASLSH